MLSPPAQRDSIRRNPASNIPAAISERVWECDVSYSIKTSLKHNPPRPPPAEKKKKKRQQQEEDRLAGHSSMGSAYCSRRGNSLHPGEGFQTVSGLGRPESQEYLKLIRQIQYNALPTRPFLSARSCFSSSRTRVLIHKLLKLSLEFLKHCQPLSFW